MYSGEEPEPPHHHHLAKMDDDEDNDNNNYHDEYDHHTASYPPPGEGHHQPPPPPAPATPQQPLQPPKPLFSPHSRPPSIKKRPTPTATPPPPQMSTPPPQQLLQPPQPIVLPTSPPPKPQPPHHHHHGDKTDNQYDDDNNRRQQLFAVVTIFLLLVGLTALIIWLLYRPSKPQFTSVSAAVYFINTTNPPPYVAASLQITVLTRNPSKRTSLYYDNLAVVVHYRNHPITPPSALPPLHHLKRSTVMMSPAIGGPPVAVPPDVAEALATDEAYGVVGLSWVLVGRVKYRAGWFRSGHNRVYVKCDVMVGFKSDGGGGDGGQVPLFGNAPCFVDM